MGAEKISWVSHQWKNASVAFRLNCTKLLVRPRIIWVFQVRHLWVVQSLQSSLPISFVVCNVRRSYLGHPCRKELWFLAGFLCVQVHLVLLNVLRAVSWGILDLSLAWKHADSLFVVLNNCTFLCKGLLCHVAHDCVSGSSVGWICVVIHWQGKKPWIFILRKWFLKHNKF